MRKLSAAAGSLVSLGAMLAITGMLALASGAHAFQGHRVYVAANCRGHAYRPRLIIVACGTGQFYADHLRYTSYGGRTARASAEMHYDDCQPNCAQGHFRSLPGSVTLSSIVRCSDNRLYYSQIHASFAGSPPGRERIAPALRCRRVT